MRSCKSTRSIQSSAVQRPVYVLSGIIDLMEDAYILFIRCLPWNCLPPSSDIPGSKAPFSTLIFHSSPPMIVTINFWKGTQRLISSRYPLNHVQFLVFARSNLCLICLTGKMVFLSARLMHHSRWNFLEILENLCYFCRWYLNIKQHPRICFWNVNGS